KIHRRFILGNEDKTSAQHCPAKVLRRSSSQVTTRACLSVAYHPGPPQADHTGCSDKHPHNRASQTLATIGGSSMKSSRFCRSTFLLLAVIAFRLAGNRVSMAQGCALNSPDSPIKHVIYIQFDNTHLRRDNPNVPSDLEQMPNLLNFIKRNGNLNPNHHTVLISHTANGILTSLTGVYSDRHGIPVANSYGVFRPNGTTAFASSFFYWTDLVSDVNSSSGDSNFGMLTADGKNAPAP